MSIESRSRQYGKVFAHWQIKEFLGSGSGGKTAVFRLIRSDSNRGVSALKVVNLIEVRGDIHDLSEFQRTEYETARDACSRSAEQEVWLMDDLRGNTNIVDYLDHTFVDWSDETGFGRDLLIRMELLKDLRSELRGGKIFSGAEALKICSDICTALIRCHKKNILHRDIKPENIFRNRDGDYKLGDFGVSRVLDACLGAAASTGIGTHEYWPAEQMTERYDKRVDIYSLGLVLYELCNQNRLPFAASTYATGREVSMRLMGTPLPEPVGASPVVAEIILKACAFDPEKRYQSAEELLRAMNRAASSLQNAPEEDTAAKSAAGAHKRTGYTTLPAEAAEEKKPADPYGTMPASADVQREQKTIPEKNAKKRNYTVKPAEKYEPKYVTRTKDSKKERETPVIWIAGAFVGLCIVALCVGLLLMNGSKKQKPDGSDLILQTETISEAAAQSTMPLAASETAPNATEPAATQQIPAETAESEMPTEAVETTVSTEETKVPINDPRYEYLCSLIGKDYLEEGGAEVYINNNEISLNPYYAILIRPEYEFEMEDGSKLRLPITYQELWNMGWRLEQDGIDAAKFTLPQGEGMSLDFANKDGKIVHVYFRNSSSDVVVLQDATAVALTMQSSNAPVFSFNGITLGDSAEEVLEVFGRPYSIVCHNDDDTIIGLGFGYRDRTNSCRLSFSMRPSGELYAIYYAYFS